MQKHNAHILSTKLQKDKIHLDKVNLSYSKNVFIIHFEAKKVFF